jgi:hypothetical protein
MLRRPTRFTRTPRRLNESDGIAYEFQMLEKIEIEPITYYDYPRVEKFDKKLWDGKDISKELDDLNEKIKRYEKLGKRILKINDNPDLARDGEEDAKTFFMNERKFVKNLATAKKVYDYYSFENETVQDIMHVIKPGEPMKSAIKKLVKMTKTAASLNPKTFKTYPFFDEYTEEDILEQIEEFDGVVRLNGVIDTYVKFEDGKAVDIYF